MSNENCEHKIPAPRHLCAACTPTFWNHVPTLGGYYVSDNQMLVACCYCVGWHMHERPQDGELIKVDAGCRSVTPFTATGYYVASVSGFKLWLNQIHCAMPNRDDCLPLEIADDGRPIFAAYRMRDQSLRFACWFCDGVHYVRDEKPDGESLRVGPLGVCPCPPPVEDYLLFVAGEYERGNLIRFPDKRHF